MSEEQKEKINKALLPWYRTYIGILMGVVTAIVSSTYVQIKSDHEVIIHQAEKIQTLEALSPRVNMLERQMVAVQTQLKLNANVEQN